MIQIYFNDVPLDRADFPNTLQGWIAFSIAFTSSVYYADKEAALELLFLEADNIIERVQRETEQ